MSAKESGIDEVEAIQPGRELNRALSVQLTPQQFEKLYLTPPAEKPKGDLSKRLGNPTALGLISFLLCFTPVCAFFCGFGNSNLQSLLVNSGTFFFIGGIGSFITAICEFILGNTFPFLVFFSFGGFWTNLGFIFNPQQNLASAYANGNADPAYNAGLAIYLIGWGLWVFILLIASTRTNAVFVLIFLSLELCLWVLVAAFFALANGNVAHAENLFVVGGGLGFVTCISGWYLTLVLVLASTVFPVNLPVGDLTKLWKE